MLNEKQAKAVATITEIYSQKTETKIIGLFGGAGCGKTFTVVEIIKELSAAKGYSLTVLAIAPTNDAKRVLKESIGNIPASVEYRTVASCLGKQLEYDEDNGKEKFTGISRDETFDVDVVVCDESSMVNSSDCQEILSIVERKGCLLIVLGDKYQHFPINEKSCPLLEICEEHIELTQTMRQIGANNPITPIVELCRQSVIDAANDFDFRYDYYKTSTVQLEDGRIGGYWCLDSFEIGINQLAKAWKKSFEINDPFFVRGICYRNSTVDKINYFVRLFLWGDKAEEFLIGELLLCKAPVRLKKNLRLNGVISTVEVNVIDTGATVRILARYPQTFSINFKAPSLKRVTKKEPTHPEVEFSYNYSGYVLIVENVRTPGIEIEIKVLPRAEMLKFEEDKKNLRKTGVEYKRKGIKFWHNYYQFLKLVHDFKYAYVVTSHAVQGWSLEIAAVNVDDLVTIQDQESRRRALYVSVSRAKRILIAF